jgi:hypothetical protein
MTNFLNLTGMGKILNKLHVVEIVHRPSMYEIRMTNSHFNGMWIVWFGNLTSTQHTIEICEKKNPADYEIVRRWITSGCE